ncbi:spore gernimation protein GerD [Virgibacillus profundi]|uniref:Spore gernimation protein GerD n=1 Tax=Virgibacillus profundi TaxID=2024555 RepID=A0A2A2I9W7_9BACI|nr:spore germination lipoprotein GerD [Virgibacillus profundi]PAV27853.1 spore gernimation protein GerD [Virgibacillus profundi]
MIRTFFILFIGLSIFFISACNGGETSGKEGEYDTTKKMVVDILQTEDGKKALQEIMSDEKMKQELVIQSDVVKQAINETLVSEKGSQMWSTLFKDPKFVEGYAKSMEKEQKKLMKNLMSDAEYQKQMLELLQNPEITDQILSVLKGQQFRSHLEETIQQTLETPLFQAKIQEILLKAAEEKGKQEGGSGSQGGGESGGGGNDEGSGGSGGGGESGGGGGGGS